GPQTVSDALQNPDPSTDGKTRNPLRGHAGTVRVLTPLVAVGLVDVLDLLGGIDCRRCRHLRGVLSFVSQPAPPICAQSLGRLSRRVGCARRCCDVFSRPDQFPDSRGLFEAPGLEGRTPTARLVLREELRRRAWAIDKFEIALAAEAKKAPELHALAWHDPWRRFCSALDGGPPHAIQTPDPGRAARGGVGVQRLAAVDVADRRLHAQRVA